jgi:hypothetical protein
MTPQSMMDAWFRLMNEAMRGNTDAQDAIKSLTTSPLSPDQMMRWMSRFMPLVTGGNMPNVKPEVFESWLDEYWKMMGVVPRHRYLELLERHENLRSRLEDSEKTVRQLQGMLGVPGGQQEAQQVIGLWGNMMQETMKAQAQWMQSFTGMMNKSEDEEPSEQPGAAEKPAETPKPKKSD